jgi:PEP-CTERM motif
MNSNSCVMFRIACRFVIALVAVAGSRSACLAGAEVTLYNVDFNGPPHVVGLTPAFGAGPFPRITPTSGGQILPAGTAEVVSAFGLLTDKPVRLTGLDGTPADPNTLGGANLQFDLSDPQLSTLKRFHAQVDVFPSGVDTSTGLGIFFDAPAIHKVEFSADGIIRVLDATGLNQVVGPYEPRVIYTVGMTFDRAAATWAAAINGIPIYQGPVDDIDLTTFRIAMTTGNTITTATAAVDNILITADVPEPGTLVLAAMALTGALCIASRRFRQQC